MVVALMHQRDAAAQALPFGRKPNEHGGPMSFVWPTAVENGLARATGEQKNDAGSLSRVVSTWGATAWEVVTAHKACAHRVN